MFFEIGRSILKHVPAVREIYTYYHCKVEFKIIFFHERSLWKAHVYSAASIRVVFVCHDMTFIILVLLSESSFSVCSFTTHFPKCFEQNHPWNTVYYLFISGLVQFLHYFIPLALVAFNMMCLARLDMHHLEFRELAEQAKYLSCQTVPRCASRLADGCGFNKGNRNYIREVQRKTSRPQQWFERSLRNRPRLDVSIGVYFWCLESFPKQSSYKKLIEEWNASLPPIYAMFFLFTLRMYLPLGFIFLSWKNPPKKPPCNRQVQEAACTNPDDERRIRDAICGFEDDVDITVRVASSKILCYVVCFFRREGP